MTHITLRRMLLDNLAGKIPPENRRVYMPPENALDRLRALTGQDFGMDVAAWRAWTREHGLDATTTEP